MQSIVTALIPAMATWWMVVGGLILAFVLVFSVATHVFKKPVYDRDTRELVDPASLRRTEVLIGGSALFFTLAGAWLNWSDDGASKVQFVVWSMVGGGLIAAVVLWRSLRR